ncbi:MAG TPA: thioredoxin domain-containing protein, partial [Planctomycetota bacterium]|nr:thioredoxin domain-containing protein [Planctomycetota bacterium]
MSKPTGPSHASPSSHASRPANRLASQTSPYLLQHAHNPVDWYPWGPEALERARAEDKPIFLSIGYSACHWCHVMERESFENEAVAAVMNRGFVCIKVDREERPDLDEIYMQATQAISGHGGWPMSVFLTPERKPYYAGTYFPPAPRYGQPGFVQVLENLAGAWASNREQVLAQSEKVAQHLRRASLEGAELPPIAPDARAPQLALLDASVAHLLSAYDREHGGFGSAPKFPHADDIRLLLRQHVALVNTAIDSQPLAAAVHTLDCMARGGIHDQLGGGFSRYSTDERWWIPHFEKMLYDNALLVPAYLEAYRITGRTDFARVARGCCEWVLREMTGPEGGLYSTQDADSEGEEGKFFAWQRDEVLAIVGAPHARLADVAWNLGDDPNFEGAWVPVRARPDVQLVAELGIAPRVAVPATGALEGGVRAEAAVPGRGTDPASAAADALAAALEPLRARLFAARDKRVHPGTDDKVLVSWNGLMISALAQASVVLSEPRFLHAAQRAARFCLTTMRPDGRRLLATYRAGKAHLNGTLADYAYLADGLLDLFEADGDAHWAGEALALARVADERFADRERAGWYFTSDDHEQLITRPRDLFDGALPSSNGVMVEVLVRLADLTLDEGLRRSAERALAGMEPLMAASPSAFARALLALIRADGAPTVVLAGAPAHAGQPGAPVRAATGPTGPDGVQPALGPPAPGFADLRRALAL